MPGRTTLQGFTVPNRPLPSAHPTCREGDRVDEIQTHAVSRRRLLAGALVGQLSPATGIVPLDANSLADLATEPRTDLATDAELLRLCGLMHALDDEGIAADDVRWSQTLLQISNLQPTSLPGLQAKIKLALLLMPFGSARLCPAWASPEERLIWSLLHDLLAGAEHGAAP